MSTTPLRRTHERPRKTPPYRDAAEKACICSNRLLIRETGPTPDRRTAPIHDRQGACGAVSDSETQRERALTLKRPSGPLRCVQACQPHASRIGSTTPIDPRRRNGNRLAVSVRDLTVKKSTIPRNAVARLMQSVTARLRACACLTRSADGVARVRVMMQDWQSEPAANVAEDLMSRCPPPRCSTNHSISGQPGSCLTGHALEANVAPRLPAQTCITRRKRRGHVVFHG